MQHIKVSSELHPKEQAHIGVWRHKCIASAI